MLYMNQLTPAKLVRFQFNLKLMFVIGLLVSALAMFFVLVRNNNLHTTAETSVSIEQLFQADGKLGRACWVAVDRTVYDLSKSLNWENGLHTTSEGRAYCGSDMSTVIDSAPHGRKMLDQLPVIGRLQ